MKDKQNQAPGGTTRPNQNEFKGNSVSHAKPDDGGLKSASKVPGHNRGSQGKG